MEIEVELSPVVTTDEVLDLARMADDAGVSRLGISDVALFRDSFQLQTLCATVTRRVRIGSLVTNPYVRHPAVVAAALATLNEVSQGRAFLGIGVGAGLSSIGVEQSHPVHRLAEFLRVVRELLAGGPVNLDGPNYRMRGARLQAGIAAPVPLVVGTRSRLVCRLAGAEADAVVVGARELSESALRRYQDWVREGAVRAGRDPAEVEIAPRVTICVSRDGEQARRSVVLYAAHYLSLGGAEQSLMPAERFERISRLAAQATGWYFEPDVAYPAELDSLVGPEIIGRFAIAGTPAECLAGLESLARLGFRSVSMNVAAVRRPGGSMYQGLRETLEGLAEIVPQVHALRPPPYPR
jgi:5,10-methylenetetrahydromethanopterin reductase